MIATIAVPNRRPFAPAVFILVVLAHVLVFARVNSGVSAIARRVPTVNVASAVAPLVLLTLITEARPGASTGSASAARNDNPIVPNAIAITNSASAKRDSAPRQPAGDAHEFPAVPLSSENLAALDGGRDGGLDRGLNAGLDRALARASDGQPRDSDRSRDGSAALAQPLAPHFAHRSRIFGGDVSAQPATMNQPALAATAPRSASASLAAYVREGVARGAYAIAGELARVGDGRCDVQSNSDGGTAPSVTCSSSELNAAGEQISSASLASLETWLRAGLVRSIEINLRDGRADIVLH